MIDTSSVSNLACWTVYLVLICLNGSLAQILNAVDFKFREEQPPGSFVGNVGAASRLAALTGNEFSRLKFNLPDSKYFRIDEKTGSLTSAVKIDREAVCDSQLVCKLTNEIIVYTSIGAGNYDILRVITATVEVLDINDNSPEFPNSAVRLTIPESNDADQVLRTRSAVDRDSGDNSVKQYRFQDPTETFRLTVHRNPDGSSYLGIVVKEKLDREIRDFYQVIVIATDGGIPQRSGVVLINITVSDMNDNAPEFSQASYNETVQENMVLKVPIIKVRATDIDAGKNADISYQFSSRVSNKIRQMFYMDEHTGEIFAQSNIDHETDKLFQFIVEAVDHGTPQHSSRANVNLHVMDMNDNAPRIVINLPPTGTEVSENEPVGKFIAHVSVLDSDSGSNGEVTCVMDDENFSLSKFSDHESNRYKVVLARPLDYEQNSYHRVTISCTDGGMPSLSNTTTFVVSVLDVNDNRPTFTESRYLETVVENQDGDVEVLQITARDWDSGEFGKVSYSIEDKYEGLFSIHQTMGILKVLQALDREENPRYEFYVFARDDGPERLSSSALVIINVGDENDEPPRFLSPAYFGDVLENQPVGTSVAVAMAVDNDSPPNAKMTYSILQQGPDHVHFSIDPASGVIMSKTTFDREEKERYHFMVRVADPAIRNFFDTCNFTVRVLDDNDHAPVIQSSPEENATLFIQYSSPVGSIITNIFAYDRDETSLQHSDLTFFIEKGDPDQLFDLNRYTGSLSLARIITARDLKTYNLVIVVQDGGDPPRFDSKQLSIIVNGTLPSVTEAVLSEQVLMAIIIVCVTVVLALIVLVTIFLVRKCDRKRRSNRANQKISEEKMYQLKPDDARDSNNLSKKGKQENRRLDSNTIMLAPDGMNIPAQGDKQVNLRRPPLDEESRLIEILKKNGDEEDDALSVVSEDTDPSDSGRGGSEDESNQRGTGIDHDHLGNKLRTPSYPCGAHSSSDSKNKYQPYQHQRFHPPKTSSQVPASSTIGQPFRKSGPSSRSPHSSVTSDLGSDISGSRAQQSRSPTNNNQILASEKLESSGRSSKQTYPFRSQDQQPSRRLTDSSSNRQGVSKDITNAHVQPFRGQPSNRFQGAQPVKNHSKERSTQPNAPRTYAPQSRPYKYTDRAYPLSDRVNSPISLPEDDATTTTSGSYAVNTEDLRHELDALVLHDTVV